MIIRSTIKYLQELTFFFWRDRDKGTRGREYERGFDRTAAGGRYRSSGGASRTHQLGAQ